MKKFLFTSFLILFSAPILYSPSSFAEAKVPQKILVKLGTGTNDLHAAVMALSLANGLQSAGAKVTLFLNLEAVRLADTRQPNDLVWGMKGHSISHLYDNFVKAGGKVLVCPHCAKVAGLSSKNLRKGAQIADSDHSVVDAILDADKILSY